MIMGFLTIFTKVDIKEFKGSIDGFFFDRVVYTNVITKSDEFLKEFKPRNIRFLTKEVLTLLKKLSDIIFT